MGKKRKQDHDSSSSDAKRCRSCHGQNGETSRASDSGISDTLLRDAVNGLKDIQDKARMEEKFKRKIDKLKRKRKKDKTKYEEDLRILKKDHEQLKLQIQAMQREGCEGLRILKEDHEQLKLQIQEMRKEWCDELNNYMASPSQRSQLGQSTRLHLVIENSVDRIIYKRERLKSIKVVLRDGANPIASDHSLASVRVDLVVLKGGFGENRRYWSREHFEESIVEPRKADTRLVENGTFDLIDGRCDLKGATIMDNSQQKEFKLGVRIAVHTEIRVLEGVSNPFKVQEGKTKNTEGNKKGKTTSPAPTRNSLEPTSTNATQHGQGPVSPDAQHSVAPPVIQDVLQKADRGKHTELPTDGTAEDNRLSYPTATVPLMVEGNGQAINGNGQQSSQQIPTQSLLWQPTSTHSMQHGQGYGLLSPSIQNPFQAAGHYPFSVPSSSIQGPLQALGCYESYQHPNCFDENSPVFSDILLSSDDCYQLNSTTTKLALPAQRVGEISAEDVPNSNVRPQIEENFVDASFRFGQVLLQWDKPHVELKEHWTFLDQLMPLYSTQSRFYKESFPSTNLMDKAHKLLASISSGDYGLKMITSVTNRATQTPQRRGVLFRPIEPYDSDDEPPVKKQRNAKYQLRFVNRVCVDYYTREQIKSEDGNLLKVALYDENNLVVKSGPLSSAFVEIVLLHGDFNAEGQDYWTSEEFSACLVHLQSVKEPPALGGDRVLALTDGETDLGNVYFQTSSFHARTGKYMMGVEIKNVREESVQEGITSPFLVRVRQGEESSCHRIASPEASLRVSKQVPSLECDARKYVGASSVKVSTEEKFERKIGELKIKGEKDENKLEEDLRILQEELRILKEELRLITNMRKKKGVLK